MSIDIGALLGQFIQGAVLPALTLILAALGVWGAQQVKVWQARSNVKQMKENAKDAVQAIEQMYPTLPNEQKSKLALQFAQTLNSAAGINALDPTQLILNESGVSKLPSTNSILATPVTPPVAPPVGATVDENMGLAKG